MAGQFNQMSISSPPSVSETEKSADYQEMWDKFHQLEEKWVHYSLSSIFIHVLVMLSSIFRYFDSAHRGIK